MRDIRFRGKSLINGGWVHGYYYNIDDNRKGNKRHIIVYESDGPGLQTIHEPVDPKTVGQYTGLKDKNGAEIYEGDILDYFCECGQDTGIVEFDSDEGCWTVDVMHFDTRDALNEWADDDVTIIGNIHENPELLEVE